MTDPMDSSLREARLQGRAEGLATGALAIALLAFVNLLGAEKGLLALVLGLVALRGAGAGAGPARTRARIAVCLGALQLVTVALVVLLFREEIGQLLALLAKLG